MTKKQYSTGFSRESQTTSASEFAFQDLQLGNYSIRVEAAGFAGKKVDAIAVRPGQVYPLVVKLSVASAAQSVEVSADSITLDTQSSTSNAVINNQVVTNIPLNGRDFTQLVKIAPGYNDAGSINGTRTNQNNWQIDGADNNDIWQNNTAANQGGVAGIAGVTIPVDSIDQFTVQTEGNAEAGRTPGGLISLGIKTGTNQFHGAAYDFNRNEFFSAKNPFTAEAARKPLLRNQQYGGDAGSFPLAALLPPIRVVLSTSTPGTSVIAFSVPGMPSNGTPSALQFCTIGSLSPQM